MTCIVGVAKNGRTWIGGDSGGTRDTDDIMVVDTPKVFKKKNFLYGYAGCYRTGQIIEHLFKEPAQKSTSDMAYLVGPFASELRSLLMSLTVIKEDEGSYDMLANLILGFNGNVYEIDAGFAVMPAMRDSYVSIGSGSSYALGAMHATPTKPPALRIRHALEAAATHAPGVCGPFHVLSL